MVKTSKAVMVSVMVAALLLSSCRTGHVESARPTTLCAEFSFRVSGRAEIIQARRSFYEAAIRMHRNYADSSHTSSGRELAPWSYTQADIKLNSEKIVLGGQSDYPKVSDPASDLNVSLFDASDPAVVKPCNKSAMALFNDVKASFAQQWSVTETRQLPRKLQVRKPVHAAGA